MAEDVLVVRINGRVVGRSWLWVGLRLIQLGAWFLGRWGVEVSVDEGPWRRVWPRREAEP